MKLQVKGRSLPFDRILFTGFRATGKSMVGHLLADRLGLEFIDTDVLLCRRIGCSVSDFVADHGWDRFRFLEEELLLELRDRSGVVIATGGGAVLHEYAWALLRRNSACVWLQADEATILHRLVADSRSRHQRPSLTGRDPRDEIRELLLERIPLYRKGSDFAVRTDDRPPEELVDEIERHLLLLAERRRD